MKITKAPKKLAEATPAVKNLLHKVASAKDEQLPDVLDDVLEWCWPRGDLHYWTQTLNRFDDILSDTIREYGIDKVQTRPFSPHTKKLIASILRFSRLLIENCTNRKLYNSYDRLNQLLMSQDPDVLEAALRLLLRPAQQFSSQGGGKADLPISLPRLATLALTWPPGEHGQELADFAQPDATISPDMLGVRFQFYRSAGASTPQQQPSRAAPKSSDSTTTASAEAGPSRPTDSTPTRPSSLSRREGRPTPQSSVSAASGLAIGHTPDGRQGDKAAAKDNNNREGLITVRIKNIVSTGKQPSEVFADIVEEYNVPSDDRFELYQKIRVAASLTDPNTRRQLLICRLMALACYGHLVTETQANSQLFLYEPDIVQKTASFVEAMGGKDQTAQAAGFYALDGLGRFGSKLSDVLSSVSASVNHGVLLRSLRLAIEDLAADPDKVSELLVDSIFGFIAFITSTHSSTTQSGSSMVVGAGLIPLLVQLVETCTSKMYMAQRTVCRAIGLIDSVLYTYPPAFQWFVDVRGLDVCLSRVSSEVEADLQDGDAQMSDDSLSTSESDPLYGKLTFGRASLLRNLLKCITHMMQSTGTAEGLRGLIDSSLLDSTQLIFKHRKVFGPQILSLMINIVATFIHNEPTSLAVLQEKKIPESFFDLVEEDIEVSSDVISAIPNGIGAICLNESGLKLFNTRADKIIPKMFSIFTSRRHLAVLQDRDNAAIFGSAMDELIRHQPSMKPKVLESVLCVLDDINRIGENVDDTKDTDADSRARLQLVPELAEGSGSSTGSRDFSVRTLALGDVVLDEVSGHRRGEQKASESDSDVMGFMDTAVRFLDGFFQSASHCKDFLRSDGPDKLLRFLSLPCLPYNFPSSTTADSLVSLLRYVAEISPGAIVGVLLKEIKRGIVDVEKLWTSDVNTSSLRTLLAPSNDADLAAANQRYRGLISLNARLYLFSSVLPAFGHSGQKTPTAFLQTLQNGASASHAEQATITDLGDLLRLASWENVLLKASAPPLPKQKPKEGESTPAPQPGFPENLLEDNAGTVDQRDSAISDTIMKDKDADPCLRNSIGLRYLMVQMPDALTNIFCEMTRLLTPKKTSDPSARRLATQVSTTVGESLVRQLKWQDSSNLSNNFAFATIMIGHVTNVVLDDRPMSVSAHTGVLLPFEQGGGVEAILHLYKRYIDSYKEGEKKEDAEAASLRLGHICGGLKVALNPMQNLSAAQVILDSSATQHMTSKDNPSPGETFKPHDLLLRLRLAILPYIRETWQKEWLHELPLSVNRSILQTLLHILQGEGEDSPKAKPDAQLPASGADGRGSLLGPVDALLNTLSAGGGSSNVGTLLQGGPSNGNAPRRPAFTVDESRIQQIVDMGFPRRAARHALTRYSNNTNAATEYLLAHPEVVGSMANEPDEPPQTAQPQTAEQSDSTPAEAGEEVSDPPAEGTAANLAVGAESSNAPPSVDDPTSLSTGEAVAVDSQGQAGDLAARADGDQAMQDTLTSSTGETKPSVKPQEKSPEVSAVKERLDGERQGLADTVTARGLELADHHDSLVFDVKDSIIIYAHDKAKTSQTLQNVIDEVHKLATSETSSTASNEAKIALRLHLLALVLNEEVVFRDLGDDLARMACNAICALASRYDHGVEREKHAPWLSPLLLVASAVLSRQEEPREIPAPMGESPGAAPSGPVTQPKALEAEAHALLELCMRCLASADKLAHEDFLALYRLLVLLTRDVHMAKSLLQRNGIRTLMQPFLKQSPRAQGCQLYLVLILRHIVEAQGSLRSSMLQEIRAWFLQSRVPNVEVGAAVRGLHQIALRDASTFLDIMQSETEITEFYNSKGTCLLQLVEREDRKLESGNAEASDETLEAPPSPTRTRAGEGDAPMLDLTGADKHSHHGARNDADGVVHLLLSELLSTLRERSSLWTERQLRKGDTTGRAADSPFDQAQSAAETASAAVTSSESDPPKNTGEAATAESDSLHTTYFYICFVMQCLTELTSSYPACKSSFLSCSKKRLAHMCSGKDSYGTPRSKSVPGIMTLFLTELIPMGFVEQLGDGIEARRRATISNCAMSTLVALSADVCFHQAIKDVAPELISTRKQLLDALARALKDAVASPEVIEVRYGRLYALAELCQRLLTVRPTTVSVQSQREDLTLHVAKIMLEKGFVTILTNALGDVDLNLPTVKTLLDAILHPLDQLTRIATRTQSKSGRDKGDSAESSDSDTHLSDGEADYDSSREDTPDFYRSSALGMHTGEMGDPDDSMEEDEDEMEEDEMGELGYTDDEDRSDLSDESTEDEDDEEMEDDIDGVYDGEGMHEHSSDEDDDEIDQLEAGEQDEEDGWTDDDSENDDSEDDDSEDDDSEDDGLDFIIGESEDIPGADEPGGGLGGFEGMYGDEEDNGFEQLDFVEDGLAELESEEDFDEEDLPMMANRGQSFDRFGANWNWVQPGEAADAHAGRGRLRAPLILPPTFFAPNSDNAGEQADEGRANTDQAARRFSLQPSGLPAAGEEDPASHPLLIDQQRDNHVSHSSSRRSRRGMPGGYQDWAASIQDLVGESAMGFFEAIFGRPGGGGPGGGLNATTTTTLGEGPDAQRIHIANIGPNGISGQGRFPSGRPSHGNERRRAQNAGTADPVDAVRTFSPMPFVTRLNDEQRIIFGELATDRVARLRNHVTWRLLPSWQEREKTRTTQRDELKEITGERDRILSELSNMRARLQQHQTEVDDLRLMLNQHRDGQVQSSADTTAHSDAQAEQSESQPTRPTDDVEMSETPASSSAPRIELESLQQGLQELDGSANVNAPASTEANGESDEAQPRPSERIVYSLNGREVDITELDIDRSVLAELPVEMQEEVIGNALRDRRIASTTSEEETSISPEFLNALPPELRAEVLEQEAAERAQRQREERQAQEATSATDASPDNVGGTEANNESSTDQANANVEQPPQRATPAEFSGDLRRHIANISSHRRFNGAGPGRSGGDVAGRDKQPERDSIQLLDSNGIAAMIRLLYFPGLSSSKRSLHKVLANLARNAKTRADILSVLLKVLVDGCSDHQAVEKSFANVSARAQSGTPGRTPALRRTASINTVGVQQGTGSGMTPAPLSRSGDEAPHLIASRSIETLLFLTSTNSQSAMWFLREDARHSKKTKGKEKERGLAPLNALLSLLEKPSILSNAQVTSTLIALLNSVTKHIATVVAQAEAGREVKKVNKAEDSTDDKGQEEQEEVAQERPVQVSKEHLAAVVRPLGTAISSKGFQNTLAVAAHLAAIDSESREAVTSALQNEAIAATASLSNDLNNLLATLPIVQAQEEEEEQQQQQQQPAGSDDQNGEGAAAAAAAVVARPRVPKVSAKSRIQSPALPVLASPASAQARLLRSLRAIEWLHGGR